MSDSFGPYGKSGFVYYDAGYYDDLTGDPSYNGGNIRSLYGGFYKPNYDYYKFQCEIFKLQCRADNCYGLHDPNYRSKDIDYSYGDYKWGFSVDHKESVARYHQRLGNRQSSDERRAWFNNQNNWQPMHRSCNSRKGA